MKQEPVMEQLLPLSPSAGDASELQAADWDYIYEPDARRVLDRC